MIIRHGLQAQRYVSLQVFDFPPPVARNHVPQVREKLSAFPNCILLCQETWHCPQISVRVIQEHLLYQDALRERQKYGKNTNVKVHNLGISTDF